MSLQELFAKFPDEMAAQRWFDRQRWPGAQRKCPRCQSRRVSVVASCKPQPFRCAECKKYFSIRTGTVMEASNLPLRLWAIALYLVVSRPKGISSVQLAKDLGVTQKTAWFLAHRIREGFDISLEAFEGPVEIDEAYIGGKEKNKHRCKRRRYNMDWADKVPVFGIVDRATNRVAAMPVVSATKDVANAMLSKFVDKWATVYTDSSTIYDWFDHESVNHSRGEYVREDCHTNSIESFWALLKRGHYGTHHWMSPQAPAPLRH